MTLRPTIRQKRADEIDLQMVRLASSLQGFGDSIGDAAICELARLINSRRTIVRNHMSEEQRRNKPG